MSERTPSPLTASSDPATLSKESETSFTRQTLPTLLPKRTFGRLVRGRRGVVVTSVDKEAETSENSLDPICSAHRGQSHEDTVLREEFDFGSLQNLQDGPFHHRPINLRDLERLESDKFIMPAQELSNQARKRSSRVRRDQFSIDGQPVAVDVPCSDDRASTGALSSTMASISQIPKPSSSTTTSITPPLSMTGTVDQPSNMYNSANANEKPMPDLKHFSRRHSLRETLQLAHPVALFADLTIRSVLRTASGILNGILEPSNKKSNIPRDMVRIRWTCCGKRLYDDFIEKSPGAARRLELHLNRPRQRLDGEGSEISSASTFSSVSMFPSSDSTAASSVDSGDISNGKDWNNRSPYVPILATPESHLATDTGPFPEQLWLLTCAEKQKFTTKLIHLDMGSHKVVSDKELALLVKEQYSKLRPSWRQIIRLRGLYTIQFVQFEVHRSQAVDIRKCPDLPEKSNINYKFLPSDVIPPVGENYLMHLFHHPEDYDDELITYKRIPKKRGMKLRVCDRADVGVGWGVHLVEGFLAYKVWALFTGVFVVASLVFAIVWATQKGDVQGAFGVAAYVCALSTLVIGCGMAYLE